MPIAPSRYALAALARLLPVWVAIACTPTGSAPPDGGDTGDTRDTRDTGSAPLLVDQDGDGWPAWAAGGDPATADCDDLDPKVTALTERLMPAGDLLQGRDDSDNASPQRVVTLSTFCVDTREVDNASLLPFLQAVLDTRGALVDEDGQLLYDLIDGDDEVPERIVQDGSSLSVMAGYEDHPPVEITWAGAAAYCLSRDQRLPTEAEWERTANGGCPSQGCDPQTVSNDWPWGSAEADCDHLNAGEIVKASDSGKPLEWFQCVGETTPTGQPAADITTEGVLGLAGNVSEWTQDWYQPDAYESTDRVDPTGPTSGSSVGPDGTEFQAKVVRGTSWAGQMWAGTTFNRTADPIEGSSNGVGFRCVRGQLE